MKKITPDKWKHFYVGIVLGAVAYGLALFIWPSDTVTALIVSSVITIAVCYGFELFSKFTGMGHYEMLDAIAGIIGGAIGIGLIILLKFIF